MVSFRHKEKLSIGSNAAEQTYCRGCEGFIVEQPSAIGKQKSARSDRAITDPALRQEGGLCNNFRVFPVLSL